MEVVQALGVGVDQEALEVCREENKVPAVAAPHSSEEMLRGYFVDLCGDSGCLIYTPEGNNSKSSVPSHHIGHSAAWPRLNWHAKAGAGVQELWQQLMGVKDCHDTRAMPRDAYGRFPWMCPVFVCYNLNTFWNGTTTPRALTEEDIQKYHRLFALGSQHFKRPIFICTAHGTRWG